jgi:hypothetical protein
MYHEGGGYSLLERWELSVRPHSVTPSRLAHAAKFCEYVFGRWSVRFSAGTQNIVTEIS